MLDLEYFIKDYKDSLNAIVSFPENFQESRITSNANIQFLDSQLQKAFDLINNIHAKNAQ